MAIRKGQDGTFCISAYGCWRPGVYESEKACRIAQRRSDEALQFLQDRANFRMPGGVGGTITEKDLADFKPAKGYPA